MIFAPGNKNESPLLQKAIEPLKAIAKAVGFKLKESTLSLDSAYDSRENRKIIFNAGMRPNIKANPRNRKKRKRGRPPLFSLDIFEERFRTIERVFAWEDKFKRLLLRFERISDHHYGMKYLALSMINLRHFCGESL